MKLTVVVPNRDRLKPEDPSTQWFLRSLMWQDCKDFSLLVVDGGSKNYRELRDYFACKENVQIISHPIGDVFHKTLLNNVGIRTAKTDYIMCTDADIMFGRKFIGEVISHLSGNIMVESRTMYLSTEAVQKIYNLELDLYNNIEACRIGKIKKRTTCGGCAAMSKKNFLRLRGYNEQMKRWGSEDLELLQRAEKMGLRIVWLGESLKDIMLFHQPHSKEDIKIDLMYQEKNKEILRVLRMNVNENGWGGIND